MSASGKGEGPMNGDSAKSIDCQTVVDPDVCTVRRRAFTLIEMLAVITIICLLIGVAVNAMMAARKTAWKQTARATAKQLARAWNTRLENDSRFPDTGPGNSTGWDASASSYGSGDWKFDTTASNMVVLNLSIHFDQNTDNQANGLRDHWGHYYHIILDRNYDGKIANPVAGGGDIHANVVVYSDGPGPTADMIIVW